MSDVKRYELHFAADSMLKVDDAGRFVLASDYDALAQRCAELGHSLAVKEEFYQDALHSHVSLAAQRDALRAENVKLAEWYSEAGVREDALRAEVERLREIREIASQCAANGGYLNSQDLIELRELLGATK